MGRVIYEPRGRAREYSPLACNLYRGCSHGCRYCYGPAVSYSTLATWSRNVAPRTGVIEALRHDAAKMRGDKRLVLLCFVCDPYQPIDAEYGLTRQALDILGQHNMKVQVLTKGGMVAARDFDLIRKYGVRFGTTLLFTDDKLRAEWEGNAAPVQSRIEAIRMAHDLGIYTWVSVEPVIDPAEALSVIENLHDSVDYWKIGKLNHMREVEARIDWHAFYKDVTALLRSLKAKFYIKNDLRVFAQAPLSQG